MVEQFKKVLLDLFNGNSNITVYYVSFCNDKLIVNVHFQSFTWFLRIVICSVNLKRFFSSVKNTPLKLAIPEFLEFTKGSPSQKLAG